MALYGIANTQLSDTFNTWRIASNSIKTQAASATGNNVFTGDLNTFTKNVTVVTNVITQGNTSITGNITVGGASTLGNSTTDLTAISGRATVGTNLAVAGNTAVTGNLSAGGSSTVGTYLDVTGRTHVGTNLDVTANTSIGGLVFAGPKAQHWRGQISANSTIYGLVTANTNNYAEVGVYNMNTGTKASSDLIAVQPGGNDQNGYIDIGINSANYNDPLWGLTGGDDAYILANPRTGATGHGDLIIATGLNGACNRIILAAGGFVNATPFDITITPNTGMIINYPTQSTSTTTGALQVQGGAGIQGNMYVQGNMNIVGNITIGGANNITNVTTLQVSNSMIYLAANNSSDNYDIGAYGAYYSSGHKHSGIVRDATDKVWKFFSGVTTEPGNTVDFGSAIYDAVKLGSITSLGSIAVTNQLSSNTIGKTGGTQFVLPTSDGTSGQALVTNGSGTLSFGSAGVSTGKAIAMAMIFGG